LKSGITTGRYNDVPPVVEAQTGFRRFRAARRAQTGFSALPMLVGHE